MPYICSDYVVASKGFLSNVNAVYALWDNNKRSLHGMVWYGMVWYDISEN